MIETVPDGSTSLLSFITVLEDAETERRARMHKARCCCSNPEIGVTPCECDCNNARHPNSESGSSLQPSFVDQPYRIANAGRHRARSQVSSDRANVDHDLLERPETDPAVVGIGSETDHLFDLVVRHLLAHPDRKSQAGVSAQHRREEAKIGEDAQVGDFSQVCKAQSSRPTSSPRQLSIDA